MKSKLLVLFVCVIFPVFLFGQEDDPCVQQPDKNFSKEFKKARNLHNSGKKSEAYQIYESLLEEYPDNLELNYYYGLGYYLPIQQNGFVMKNHNQALKALEAFNRIYNVCPYYKIQHNLYAAQLAYFMEKFADAVRFAKVITENPDMVPQLDQVEEAEIIIRKSEFYAEVLENPVPFDPKPVEGISTAYDEYLAALSPDGARFYFTRRQPYQNSNRFFTEEKEDREFFSMSEKKVNGKFDVGAPLPPPFNSSSNEGSPTINLTNDLLIFSKMTMTTINGHQYPNYDLYYTEYIDGEWTEPKSLGSNVNRKDSWESQPSLSSDGKILFFASDRPGGYGGSDIWFTERHSDGSWQKPVNLGPVINTGGNERSPFLHTDSKTLYFSSSGHPGLGGLDIFYSKLDEKKGWQRPVNIGHPINTENDDLDFFVSLDGKTAYFSSNNIETEDWNIYQFDLYEKARPRNMVIVKGQIENEENDYKDAVVEIRDTASNILARAEVNQYSGKYAIATEMDEKKPADIIVNVRKEGHAFDTKLIKTEEIVDNVVTSDAEVKKIEVGKTYHLHDIYFGTNLYSLTSQSRYLIDLFIEFLKENPGVKVEIQGHTDNTGNQAYNQLLSERRAKSVYDYVLSRNINADRLRYKGYGQNEPVANNDTPEGRSKNRRTVFLIYEQ